jgi:hypothetical protein
MPKDYNQDKVYDNSIGQCFFETFGKVFKNCRINLSNEGQDFLTKQQAKFTTGAFSPASGTQIQLQLSIFAFFVENSFRLVKLFARI